MKAIYFDMDGTIADLYGYENWLNLLHEEDTTPYEECGVLVDIEELRQVLNDFVKMGVTLGIISWGAMNGSREYCKRTRKAKIAWCEKYFPNVFTEYHVVKYGTPKHYVRKEKDSILVDDNAEVRDAWKGETVDATQDIIELLRKILLNCKEENRQKCWNNPKNKWDKANEQGLISPLFKEHFDFFCGLYMIGQTTFNPITNEKRYWVKVGKTSNADSRLNSYLTHAADVYFIDWHTISHKSRLSDEEKCCHIQLSFFAETSRTEWFKVSESLYFELCEKGFSLLNL